MHAVSKCRLTLSLNFINKLKSVSDFSSPPCIETRRECENFNGNRAFFLLHLSEFLNFKEKREHVLLTLSRLEHRIVLSWLTLQRYTRNVSRQIHTAPSSTASREQTDFYRTQKTSQCWMPIRWMCRSTYQMNRTTHSAGKCVDSAAHSAHCQFDGVKWVDISEMKCEKYLFFANQ